MKGQAGSSGPREKPTGGFLMDFSIAEGRWDYPTGG